MRSNLLVVLVLILNVICIKNFHAIENDSNNIFIES